MPKILLILLMPVAIGVVGAAWLLGYHGIAKRLGFDVDAPWFAVGAVTSFLVALYLISIWM